MFERIRRLAPRVRTAARNFVRELAHDPVAPERETTELERVQQRLELALVGSNSAVWDIELNMADLPASKVELINIAEFLGYDPATFPTRGRHRCSCFTPTTTRA